HADALAALGQQALENGDDAAAGGLFDRALAREPSHLAALLGKGAVFSRAKDWKSAEGFYNRAVVVQPDYPFAYIDRGRARQALDDTAGALQDFSRAIELSPEYPWSYIDRAKLFLRQASGRRRLPTSRWPSGSTLASSSHTRCAPERSQAPATQTGRLRTGSGLPASSCASARIRVPGRRALIRALRCSLLDQAGKQSRRGRNPPNCIGQGPRRILVP